MTHTNQPQQLRLIIETDDFESALRFYRDVLGMPELPAFATEGDDRVAILTAGVATLELATRTHARNIDRMENVPSTQGTVLRLALEVADTAQATDAAVGGGAELIAAPVVTPFRSINSRVQGPDGWQVTFFQETESPQERHSQPGFTVDGDRPR
ncbi:MAG: VOC family protein [Mycetocola sp.]